MIELLSAKHPGIPPTLRDDRLSEEVTHTCSSHFSNKPYPFFIFSLFLRMASASVQTEQLRQHYMTKYDSEVADAHQALQPVLQNLKELKRKVRTVLHIVRDEV